MVQATMQAAGKGAQGAGRQLGMGLTAGLAQLRGKRPWDLWT